MSLHRYDAKRDANEKEIVDHIRARGLSVERLNTPLDLLVGYKGITFLVEVKMPGKKLNKKQQDFVKTWQGGFRVVNSIVEAETFVMDVITAASHCCLE